MPTSLFDQAYHILLVEDRASDAETVIEALAGSKSTRVHRVEDGERAIAFLRRKEGYSEAPFPDLLLIDLDLPGIDGSELLGLVKNDERLKRIPAVILASSPSEGDVALCYSMRGNGFVRKPENRKDFIDVIRRIGFFWSTIVAGPPRSEN